MPGAAEEAHWRTAFGEPRAIPRANDEAMHNCACVKREGPSEHRLEEISTCNTLQAGGHASQQVSRGAPLDYGTAFFPGYSP